MTTPQDGGSPERPRRVVVAGASGFVGRALVRALAPDHEVVGLTRSHDLPEGIAEGTRGLRWRTADLFSLLELEHALEGADIAVYLVHSMSASAELTQGDFSDFDLLLADNFARAAKTCGWGTSSTWAGSSRTRVLSPGISSPVWRSSRPWPAAASR